MSEKEKIKMNKKNKISLPFFDVREMKRCLGGHFDKKLKMYRTKKMIEVGRKTHHCSDFHKALA